MTVEEARNTVEVAIEAAENNITLSSQTLALAGMNSPKVRMFLNKMGSQVDTYLEIGLWKGASVISALEGNSNLTAIGCDNWSQFRGPVEEFEKNIAERLPGGVLHVYHMDCYSQEFLDKLDAHPKVDAFYFDGDHSYEAQYKAVELAQKVMGDTMIFIVDDWKKWGKAPTLDAIKALDIKVEQFWELDSGWWEGWGVFVLSNG